MSSNKLLLDKDKDTLINTLKERFEKNMKRHKNLKWSDIQVKLESNPASLSSLIEMEKTGGEPDVISFDQGTGRYVFCDCSMESPKGRRRLCYDKDALESRKTYKPKDSAEGMAMKMGIELLDEEMYRVLQVLGDFDLKTSSWLKTPYSIRKLGGAIFGDKRYETVFIYHNGAESYYGSRGFRGYIRV
mgnify:CR=1 FL=1